MRPSRAAGRTGAGFAVAALIVLLALVAAGSASVVRRDVVLRAPDQAAVVLLRAPRQVCEGPLTTTSATQKAAIWGSSVIGSARVRVDIQDAASPRTLATGRLRTTTRGEHVVSLNRPVPAGRRVRVCLAGELNTFAVLGSGAGNPDVVMTGGKPGMEFSLALLDDRHSLLGSLSTAFARAALFKPSWVGSWTFWLLTAGLLATFGLAGMALVSASAEDDAGDRGRSADAG